METIIRIKPSELTPALLKRLKIFFEKENEIEIAIKSVSDFGFNKKESREEYIKRVKTAIDNLTAGKYSVSLSEDEFYALSNELLNKQ